MTATDISAPTNPPAGAAAKRPRAKHAVQLAVARAAVVIFVILGWTIVSVLSDLVAGPVSTLQTLWSGFVDGWLLSPLADTLTAVGLGFAIACGTGLPLGAILGAFPRLGRVVDPFFTSLFAVPRVVLYPVILAAIGVGLEAKVWMAVLSAVLPLVVNTNAGVRNTNPTLVKLGRSVGCGSLRMMQLIYLPAAMPAIMIGIRIGLSISFISVIVAELFAATNGLGLVIQSSYGLQQYSRMFSVVLLVTVLAFVVNLALWSIERRLRDSTT